MLPASFSYANNDDVVQTELISIRSLICTNSVRMKYRIPVRAVRSVRQRGGGGGLAGQLCADCVNKGLQN